MAGETVRAEIAAAAERLTWEQKLEAVQALVGQFGVTLAMRRPGDWLVHAPVEIKKGEIVESVCVTDAAHPAAAIESFWHKITVLAGEEYLVSRRAGKRVAVRWNGWMWVEVEERTERTERTGRAGARE